MPLLTLTLRSPMFWMCTVAPTAYVLPGRETSTDSIARPRPVVPMVIDVPLPVVHCLCCQPMVATCALRQITLLCCCVTLMASIRKPWPRVPGADVQPTFWTCVLTSKSLEEFVGYACAGAARAPTLSAINPAAAMAAARVRQFAPFKNFVLWFTGLLFCLPSLPEMKRDRLGSDGQNRLEPFQLILTALTNVKENQTLWEYKSTRPQIYYYSI